MKLSVKVMPFGTTLVPCEFLCVPYLHVYNFLKLFILKIWMCVIHETYLEGGEELFFKHAV